MSGLFSGYAWGGWGRFLSVFLLIMSVLFVADLCRIPERQVSARILLFSIKIYKAHVSPRISFFIHCRFEPTCSAYGYEAVKKYGALKGGLMALWRIMRCNPWNKSDRFDPVP